MTHSSPAKHEHAVALNKIRKWLASPEAQVFRLFGLAGTGKMTLAREVADMVPGKVAFVAFAGKAAVALRAHGCLSATTIHSLIYNVVPDVTGKVHFILKCGKQAPQCALIIVDECSTVDADVAKDLLSCQIPVLTLGDPFQLPSIDGIEFFMNAKPDATLTEVLRQEKNSPILELAARVRQNLNLKCGRYGDSEILPLSQLNTDHLLRANQILVGTNELRHRVNREMRNLLVHRRQNCEGALYASGLRIVRCQPAAKPQRGQPDIESVREAGGCLRPRAPPAPYSSSAFVPWLCSGMGPRSIACPHRWRTVAPSTLARHCRQRALSRTKQHQPAAQRRPRPKIAPRCVLTPAVAASIARSASRLISHNGAH